MPQPPPLQFWKGVTVLVVEDHPDSRDVLGKLLRSVGARPLLARDGRDALVQLEKETPDLVLCDLLMPRMDGFAFLELLRRDPIHGKLPVVAVTALGADADLHRTWAAGFDGHLTKPIDYDSILALLNRVLSARLGFDDVEPPPA